MGYGGDRPAVFRRRAQREPHVPATAEALIGVGFVLLTKAFRAQAVTTAAGGLVIKFEVGDQSPR